MRWWPLHWLLPCNCQQLSGSKSETKNSSSKSELDGTSQRTAKTTKLSRVNLFGLHRKTGYKELGFCNRFYLDKTPYGSTVTPALNSLSSETISCESTEEVASFEEDFSVLSLQDVDRHSSASDNDMVRRIGSCDSTDTEEVCTIMHD